MTMARAKRIVWYWCFTKGGFTAKQLRIIKAAINADLSAHFSKGNEKIGKMINFSLLPIFSCSKEACKTCGKRGACYAVVENRYPSALFNRVQNTLLAMVCPDVIGIALDEYMKHTKIKTIRLHEAGDFINADYLRMWLNFAANHPEYDIYTYSKQYFMMNHYADDIMASPLTIKVSTWCGLSTIAKVQIAKLLAKGFTLASLIGDEYSKQSQYSVIPCPNQINGTNCDSCNLCRSKKHSVGFVPHGSGKKKILQDMAQHE